MNLTDHTYLKTVSSDNNISFSLSMVQVSGILLTRQELEGLIRESLNQCWIMSEVYNNDWFHSKARLEEPTRPDKSTYIESVIDKLFKDY